MQVSSAAHTEDDQLKGSGTGCPHAALSGSCSPVPVASQAESGSAMLQEAAQARLQAVEAWAAAQLLCAARLRRRWQVGSVQWNPPSPASLVCLAQAHGDKRVCKEQASIMGTHQHLLGLAPLLCTATLH